MIFIRYLAIICFVILACKQAKKEQDVLPDQANSNLELQFDNQGSDFVEQVLDRKESSESSASSTSSIANNEQRPNTTVPAFFEISPVTENAFNNLIDAISKRTEFDFEGSEQGIIYGIERVKTSDLLTKNFINFKSEIDIFRSIWSYKKDAGEQTFFVDLEFQSGKSIQELEESDKPGVLVGQKRAVIVFKNSAATAQYKNGAAINIYPDQETRYFIKGEDKEGMALVIPKFKSTGPIGMLLCPRDYEVNKIKGGSRTFEFFGPQLRQVDYSVSAQLQGRVLSGLGPGYAGVSIQTTANVPPAINNFDESRNVNPAVALVYEPNYQTKLNIPTDFAINRGAILTSMILHNSFNQKLITRGIVRISVKKIEIKSFINIKHQGTEFRLAPGLCLGIVKDFDLSHQVIKEKL